MADANTGNGDDFDRAEAGAQYDSLMNDLPQYGRRTRRA